MVMRLPRPGETFAEEYAVQDQLGEGGFAVVHRAVWRGRTVALKVLKPQGDAYSFEVVARFNREAAILAALSHPNIPRLFDHGRAPNGLLYLASEFVPGDPLRTLVRHGAVSEELAEHIVREALAALDEPHQKGLLHRDIKPENILLTPSPGGLPRVTLLDFGIARHAAPEQDGRLTETGVLVGTPRYMSPEQLMSRPLTPASDLYSLAVVGAEMLRGSNALHGGSLTAQVERASGATIVEVPATRGPIGRFLRRALAVRASDRPQSAAEAIRILNGEVGAAPLVEAKASRSRVMASVGLGVLVIAAVAFVLLGSEPEPEMRARTVENPLAATPAPQPAPAFERPDFGPEAEIAREPANDCPGMKPIDSGEVPISGPDDFGLGNHFVRYHVPAGYDPTRAHPVVWLFHDTRPDTPQDVIRRSGFDRLADEEQFVIIAPSDSQWLGGTPWTRSSKVLIPNALEAVRHDLCLDYDRMYAVGNGRGGRAAMYTACLVGDARVRAVATNGWRTDDFTPKTKESDCDKALPYIHVIGSADPDMPLAGASVKRCTGQDDEFASLERHERHWHKRLACKGEPREWAASCSTWSCDKPYVSCVYEGDGRSWGTAMGCDPGGPETPDLAETIWRFFQSID